MRVLHCCLFNENNSSEFEMNSLLLFLGNILAGKYKTIKLYLGKLFVKTTIHER